MNLFADDQVNLKLLRERAYNLRWATQSEDVIPLTAADPDFPVAPEIREAIAKYAQGGVFSYGPAEGLPAFRAAAAKVLRERKGIGQGTGAARCESTNIFPIDSAASAMYLVARFALKPGDEAIIFDPVDFLFQESVLAAGAKPVRLKDLSELESLVTSRTRMIGVCNPQNPTGRVLTRQELEEIGRVAVKHKLWIMNDEIWSDIVYKPHQHVSMAALDREIADRVLSVYGFSKTFGLAGLRIGFIHAASAETLEKLIELSGARTTAAGVATLSQVAATAAYEKCWYWADAFVDHLQKMRDYAVERVNKMPGLTCRAPEGTYVLFPDIRATGRTSEELATYLLEKGRVAVVPGAAKWFGPGATGHIRICFSTSRKILSEGLDRIESALKKL